ncbi:preprotein translocase subunit YajC [Corynebacterium amycolatum]|nr:MULTISPECIES: preprotein translocase subunit YajC [Corynebacterium]KAA9227581.1 preprotein translocase subunit YajC [Corynebacterium amycolatum]MBC6768789.1 preprotein translocase subunit YajC [Corynebacterium sp. LK15]
MDQTILLLLIFLFLALPIWQIIKQNKQVRTIRDMQDKLAPGAEVITGSGMHGVVVDTTETTVDLIIADGIVTRWEKGAIARNLTTGTGASYAHRDRRGRVSDAPDDHVGDVQEITGHGPDDNAASDINEQVENPNTPSNSDNTGTDGSTSTEKQY